MEALLVIPQVKVLKLNLNNFQEWRSSVQIVDRMQKTWNQILIIMKLVYNGLDIQNMFLFKQRFASNADAIFRNCYGSPQWMFWLCCYCNVPFFTRIDSIWNLVTVSNSKDCCVCQILNLSSYVVVKVEKRGLWICPGYCLTLDGGYKSTDLSSSADQLFIQEIFSFVHVICFEGQFLQVLLNIQP